MDKDFIQSIIQEISKASKNHNLDYFCISRDIFQARLDSYALKGNKYLESAVIGEIGNNTFDHNWDFAKDETRGSYFNPDYNGFVIVADFGQGIRKSLSKVRVFNSDIEAIKTAFTERISGRAPEQRGNGLKFVLESIKNRKWILYFHSGTAVCQIENGDVSFSESNYCMNGCLAVMKF